MSYPTFQFNSQESEDIIDLFHSVLAKCLSSQEWNLKTIIAARNHPEMAAGAGHQETPRIHKALALGPTGNSQGTVKFFCLETGRVLKHRSFAIYPMPDRVIKKVITAFKNRNREPFDWEDEFPEEDSEFQGLLESKATFPDISAEIPGVCLESELPTTADKYDPKPDEAAHAGAARENADINAAEFHQPVEIEANPA